MFIIDLQLRSSKKLQTSQSNKSDIYNNLVPISFLDRKKHSLINMLQVKQ